MIDARNPVASGWDDADLGVKVCDFFARNPREFLDTDSIAIKFGVSRGCIHTELSAYVGESILTRTFGDEHGYVYRRGPNLSQWAGVKNA